MLHNLFLALLIVVLILGIWGMFVQKIDFDHYIAKFKNFLTRVGLLNDPYKGFERGSADDMESLFAERYQHLDRHSQAFLQKMKEDQQQITQEYQDQLRNLKDRSATLPAAGSKAARSNSSLERPLSGTDSAVSLGRELKERQELLLESQKKREDLYRDLAFPQDQRAGEEEQRRIKEKVEFQKEQLDQMRENQRMRYEDLLDTRSNLTP